MLTGINAPDRGATGAGDATDFVVAWLAQHSGPEGLVHVTTVKDRLEKWGRYLAWVRSPDGVHDLTGDMIAAGHAVAYDGHGPRPG